ncbi:hypothetical protein K4A83_13655 [Spirulina subsalsa FACHB-351]|uniref:Uncharacterized protein n=1 Tax=Spirulina subsalsa FACHB-351 TaxID=234711 RepID=A0ABT3L733_9CYAN|nr:hypothetical protein [Spirulina subsalsa]MCW6037309.1 hypothetical protein [Spirulina subsalsa FACHB-351]
MTALIHQAAKYRAIFLHILFCAIGVVILFYPVIQSSFALMPSNPGDSRLVNYFLEHYFQLFFNRQYIGSFWSAPFFFPYSNTLTFSENLFGASPVYWVFRFLFDESTSFQLWMIAVSCLNFFSFSHLLKQFEVNLAFRIIGSFVFAFSLPRISALGFPQLLPQFFTPLSFLYICKFIQKPTIKYLTLFLSFIYLQILSGIYLGWFLCFSIFIFVLSIYSVRLNPKLQLIKFVKSSYKISIPIFSMWLLLIFIFLQPYLKTKSVFGSRPYSEVDTMLPRLSSWFSIIPGSALGSALQWKNPDLPMIWEHYLFSGFTLILFSIISIIILTKYKKYLVKSNQIIAISSFITGLVIIALSLRLPNGFSLWKTIYDIFPGASVIRAVSRIWTVVYFYILITNCICLTAIFQKKILRNIRLFLVFSLTIIVVLEQVSFTQNTYAKASFDKESESIEYLLKKSQNCDFAYVQLSSNQAFWADQVSAMWGGIKANVPVINGYSGNVPPNYGSSTVSMNLETSIHWLQSNNPTIQGNLCMVSRTTEEQSDPLVKQYSIDHYVHPEGGFEVDIIPVPIE